MNTEAKSSISKQVSTDGKAATDKIKSPRLVQAEVTSDAMDKSVVVKIERKVKHPLYGKYIRKTTKLHVHDPENSCHVGDLISIKECRPMSKTKSWVLVEIIKKAQ